MKNVNTDAMEWVYDWYGPYPDAPQTDPVGPATGFARVVRGGGIMAEGSHGVNGFGPYYRRMANRASVSPVLRGSHPIGFRIVEAPLPSTPPDPVTPAFPTRFVKNTGEIAKTGPDPDKPWFRHRAMLPIPPEDQNPDALEAAGIPPGVNGHNHSAGLTVAPNGDVVWIAFSASASSGEYWQNPTFVISRLRYSAESWDFPELFYDFADVNDQSALLWTDNGTVRFFGGGVGLQGVPFRMQSSRDNGKTWTPVQLPLLHGPIGGFSPQPITSAFRLNGAMYLSSDAVGGQSLLWESKDGGITWSDTGGRTAGRHTAFVPLKDGSILALGGKNTDIDGYMPQTTSHDAGSTWSTPTLTPFPALASNQRPTVVRLASGRLFFAGDWQARSGKQPADIRQHGSYVALSEDDGKTWKLKTLPGTLPHESYTMGKRQYWNEVNVPYGILGYTVAAQAPNGIIHLISSMNHPSQHFEMNEAWILSDSDKESEVDVAADGKPIASKAGTGRFWSGMRDLSGRYLLNGREVWSGANGTGKQYEVTWRAGRKVGSETLWSVTGTKLWDRQHRDDGTTVWTQFWSNGQKKHESTWRDGRAVARATAWSPSGTVTGSWEFVDGNLKK